MECGSYGLNFRIIASACVVPIVFIITRNATFLGEYVVGYNCDEYLIVLCHMWISNVKRL